MNLWPYFKLVACTKKILGPTGSFEVLSADNNTTKWNVVAKSTIFPRFLGFVVDPALYGLRNVRNLQPFHHGVKNRTELLNAYGPFGVARRNKTCLSFANALSKDESAKAIREGEKYGFNQTGGESSQVPRWQFLNSSCINDSWCPPIAWNSRSVAWAVGVVARNGVIQEFKYYDPGHEWHSVVFSGDS
jgi:hypothetical protein